MKLYRIAGHTWAGTQAEAKALSRDFGAMWQPVEVPTDKPSLLAWLNDEGRVIPATEPDILIAQLSSASAEPGDYILGPPTKDPPRVSPAFLGDLADGANFVPVAKAAEIDRLLKRCPKCHGSSCARVLEWIAAAPLDELQLVAERIKEHVAELNRQIDEGGTRQ